MRDGAKDQSELAETCSCAEAREDRCSTIDTDRAEAECCQPLHTLESGPGRASCRVCLEEDDLGALCQPCQCIGSMSNAHPECIQQWIDEKGDMLCEICKQPYAGNFNQPSPQQQQQQQNQQQDLTPMRLPLFRGFLISADPETGTFTRRGLHEEDLEFEQERASATWCFAAVLIFMILLLLRHVFEAFSGQILASENGGFSPEMPSNQTEHQIYTWGALNGSSWESSGDPWIDGLVVAASPGAGFGSADVQQETVSVWVIIAWLVVRLSIVLVPMLLAYRLMVSLKEAQERNDMDRFHAAMFGDVESGTSSPTRQPSNATELVRVDQQNSARTSDRG